MGYPEDEFADTWAGLIPDQPRERSSWLLWAAVAAAGVFAACLCLGGGYLAARQLLLQPTPTVPLIIPTLPGETPLAEADLTRPPTPFIFPSNTPALVAPTATLGGQVTTLPTGTGNVDALRLPVAPTIDGSLGEWPGTATVTSAFRIHQVTGWDGTDDLTAVWQLAWDQVNLYIGVDVTDDVHVQTQTGNQIFRGDSLDMQFDTDRVSDFGDGLSPDDFQIIFSPGDFAGLPESAFRFKGTDAGQIVDAPGHNIMVRAQKTATGYALEAAIPWSDLNLTAVPGLIIGLALNANDNDTPGAAVQEVMMSHVSTRTLTDPRGWGTLSLR